MLRRMALAAYNFLLPLAVVVAAPAWIVRMSRRGGLGPKLWERLAVYDRAPEFEPCGGIYVHAVSVGEVLVALKLIAAWRKEEPGESFILAVTTSTGYALAREKAGDGVRVIYAPVDVPVLVRRVLSRFEPRLLLLIESELWPNLVEISGRRGIPVAMANARLSPRSERRYRALRPLVASFLERVRWIGAQAREHEAIWRDLGGGPGRVLVTGSVKFDQDGQIPPRQRREFGELLRQFGADRPVVLAASTHAGEELLVARAVREVPGALPLIVPRHAERRREVKKELEAAGFEVILRSGFGAPSDCGRAVLVADTTGELRDWTAHADVAVIGKSFLARGGQNPTEAIAAGIPVVSGVHMENFEPLVTELREAGAISTVAEEADLPGAIARVLADKEERARMTAAATGILHQHEGATARTVTALRELASGT
jgi:3-deoxy-D-manno-octulosonic-acid transferase